MIAGQKKFKQKFQAILETGFWERVSCTPLPKSEGLRGDIQHSMSMVLNTSFIFDSLWQSITICDSFYYKVQQLFHYKIREKFITKYVKFFVTKRDSFITKCDNFITKYRLSLQIATVQYISITPIETGNTWYGRQQSFLKSWWVSLFTNFNFVCVIRRWKMFQLTLFFFI